MYVVVRDYKSDPGQADEVLRLVEKSFVPMVRSIPGFVSYYAFKTQHGFATISVFCSKSGADESISMAADWVGRNVASFALGPPEILSGDTMVHESAVKEMAVCG